MSEVRERLFVGDLWSLRSAAHAAADLHHMPPIGIRGADPRAEGSKQELLRIETFYEKRSNEFS